MYLGIDPPETGGTTFRIFVDAKEGGYRSRPEPGTLLICRNLRPGSTKIDVRTMHQAEPTTRGPKYSMRAFICEKEGWEGHWD
jgi:hypothetical protein